MIHRYFLSALFTICFTIIIFTKILFAQNEVTISASKDNTLYESTTGATSNGAGSHFFVGNTNQTQDNTRRGLIAFDITSNIPEGASIESVTLTLNMSRTNQAGAQTINLHRVSADADWGEGASDAVGEEGGGATATTDDATWIHRIFDTELWSTAGGDFSSTVSASQSVSGLGSYTWSGSGTDQMVLDVQDWLDDIPSTNFGWILIGNEAANPTAKRFDTKENSTEANRPALTVTFSPPTSVEDNRGGIPTEFSLAQNYPNPFNPSTIINYTIPQSANLTTTRLEIFNMLGQKVRTLVNSRQSAGSYSVQWHGKDDAGNLLASGVYIYRLRAEKFVDMKKMIFMR